MATATRLRIPAGEAATFSALVRLREDDFRRLLDVLQSTETVARLDALEDRATEALPEVPEAEAIIGMLFSMDRLRETRRETPEATASKLAQASGVALSDDERSRARARLAQALGSPGLRLASKATDLLYANERNIESFRIVTEMRPLFEEDPSVIPSSAVIVHRLEVDFFGQTGASETRHFGLDDNDLDRLHETVLRARAKAQTMEKLATQSGLTLLNPSRGSSES